MACLRCRDGEEAWKMHILPSLISVMELPYLEFLTAMEVNKDIIFNSK
jgi:hypothetical protein